MNTKDLADLITFSATAATETTDPTQKARYEGMREAFSFILAEENRIQQYAEHLAYESINGRKAAAAKCGKISA